MSVLFEPRFNRVDMWGFAAVLSAAWVFQTPWPFIAAIPLGLLSSWGERKLEERIQ